MNKMNIVTAMGFWCVTWAIGLGILFVGVPVFCQMVLLMR